MAYSREEPDGSKELEMGFFAQHGSFSEGTGRKFSVAESGVYICALIDIEAVQVGSLRAAIFLYSSS